MRELGMGGIFPVGPMPLTLEGQYLSPGSVEILYRQKAGPRAGAKMLLKKAGDLQFGSCGVYMHKC
jgi:hypothetical protein